MAGSRRKSSSPSATQPDTPLFLLDECLSGLLVQAALSDAGMNVKPLAEVFGTGAKDLDWMPKAGAMNYAVVTRDNRIRKNRAEREAFISAPIRGFFFAARGSLSGAEMAEILAANANRMLKAVDVYASPFIAIVRRGSVEILDDDDCPRTKIAKKHRPSSL